MKNGTQKRKMMKVAWALMGASLLWLSGCAVEAGEIGDDVSTRTQELRCKDAYGNPSNDPNCPWKTLARQLPSEPANDISHRMSPAICANQNSTKLTVTVDTNNQYRVLQSHWYAGPNWLLYGASKTWSSRPACTMRENDPASGESGFVIAGKATDNKIYASAGIMANADSPQANPSFATSFSTVSGTVYNSGGGPALSMGGFGGPEAVVLVHMGDGDRKIYAHTRDIPFLGAGVSWSSRITGPTLPTGWTPVGAPAIAKLPVTFQIVVHARNAQNQDRLFETHFFVGSSKHFSNNIGSPASSWTMLASMGRIDDEPALEYHDVHGSTVWFRRLNTVTNKSQIMQTTGFPLGSGPVLAVYPAGNIDFIGSPAAMAGWANEGSDGTHTMSARTTSNEMWNAITDPDGDVVP